MTWEQFVSAIMGLAIIALYRLLNKYLPPKTVKERESDSTVDVWTPGGVGKELEKEKPND